MATLSRALVVVDFQNDFAHPQGSLYVPECAKIGERLTQLADEARCVVLTKCWHPDDDPSFKANGGEWPIHGLRGKWGSEMSVLFRSVNVSMVLHKVGYSPFMNGGDTTGLYEWLDTLGVHELGFGGVALDFCVRAGALDALQLGFKVSVHADAVAAVDTLRSRVVFEELAAKGAAIV